ncbi:hypothetical protein PUN4_1070002 [Paraburkholderia unamae]|nr:hypothetical protein PUN4_1070002 [Paraburkholderia unamae]
MLIEWHSFTLPCCLATTDRREVDVQFWRDRRVSCIRIIADHRQKFSTPTIPEFNAGSPPSARGHFQAFDTAGKTIDNSSLPVDLAVQVESFEKLLMCYVYLINLSYSYGEFNAAICRSSWGPGVGYWYGCHFHCDSVSPAPRSRNGRCRQKYRYVHGRRYFLGSHDVVVGRPQEKHVATQPLTRAIQRFPAGNIGR